MSSSNPGWFRSRYALAFGALLSAAACASQETPPPAYPSRGPVCSYVGIEASSAPAHDTVDAVSLIAVYRLRDSHSPPPSTPIELKFLVQRSRINELQGQLEAHPEVVCQPDQNSKYRVEAPNLGDFAPEPL
jgi:hypothetical protein